MKKITLLISIMLITTISFSQNFKIACIGASMTEGANATLNYPYILDGLLPIGYYSVYNLGVGGKTVTMSGNSWILNTDKPDSLKIIQPDIVTILLGTNDCTVGADGELYKSDYLKLIDSVYKWSAPEVKIYICNLPPVFDSPSEWGHDNTVLVNTINPKILEVATQSNLPLIDLYTPFYGHPEYMIDDGVHPNATGYNLLADLMYDAIRDDITSIAINTVGSVPTEITSEGGFLVFEASFEPAYATHTDIVWSMEPIDGDAIMGGRTIQAVSNGTVKVIATSPEGGPVVTDEMIVTISGQPETSEIIEHPESIVFPNPTNNILHLKNISDFKKLEIFDLQSKNVFELQNYSETINLSSLPNNIYIMRITNIDRVLNYTIIKK